MPARPPATVDEYLALVPEPARTTLQKTRAAIRAVLPPEATEAISYRIPMYRYKGPVVGFAAFKSHCSLFAISGTLLDDFAADLKGYSTSKGTIRFPMDKPLPASLVKRMVKARLALNEARPSRAARATAGAPPRSKASPRQGKGKPAG
jgi:uncharacterized protein YdhG (YjbR/CyaY superfamily)